jgi:hypothetical protein
MITKRVLACIFLIVCSIAGCLANVDERNSSTTIARTIARARSLLLVAVRGWLLMAND